VNPPDTLTILFPMWNEELIVPATVHAAREVGEQLVAEEEIGDFEVLIVDDASTDTSGEIAEKLAADDPRLRVVHHEVNRGVGGALRTGFAEAHGDLVLYTHADLPCDLAELQKALRLLRLHSADLVSAYRHDRRGEGPRQLVYSVAYNALIRSAFGLHVRDVNFAFKLCRRSMLEQLQLTSERSFIDAELLVRADRMGFRIIQFGVDYFPRKRGVSTLSSPPDILGVLGDLLTRYRELKSIRPLPPAALQAGTGGVVPLRRGARSARRPRRGQAPVTGGRLLIVNADDFGLTPGISNGILRAHNEGIVTSTSVLAVGPAFERTGPLLVDAPELGVGAHLAAVGEDPPLLSAAEIPSLVDRRGAFPRSWRQFVPRALGGRVDPDDLRREFTAQIERLRALGIELTHVDTHQHLHLWPLVREVVLELAGRFSVPAVRVPYSSGRTAMSIATDRLALSLERRAAEIGLGYAGASAGLDPSGSLDGAALARALDRLAATEQPTLELWAHPGERRDPERVRYRWGYRWGDELAVLTGPAARYVVARQGFTLGTFAALAGPPGPRAT
jgi:chitin disaccharide deacetylase